MEKIARKNYSKIPALVEIPNLLDVQLESYRNFILSTGRDKPGESLQSVFETIFPIVSARENFVLEYISYSIGEPKYSVDESDVAGVASGVVMRWVPPACAGAGDWPDVLDRMRSAPTRPAVAG